MVQKSVRYDELEKCQKPSVVRGRSLLNQTKNLAVPQPFKKWSVDFSNQLYWNGMYIFQDISEWAESFSNRIFVDGKLIYVSTHAWTCREVPRWTIMTKDPWSAVLKRYVHRSGVCGFDLKSSPLSPKCPGRCILQTHTVLTQPIVHLASLRGRSLRSDGSGFCGHID